MRGLSIKFGEGGQFTKVTINDQECTLEEAIQWVNDHPGRAPGEDEKLLAVLNMLREARDAG